MRAEVVIDALGEGRVADPIASKLRGDIALAKGNPGNAIELYQAACKAAKIEPVASKAEAKCETAEKKAKLWGSYSRKMIMARLKDLHRKRKAKN